MGMFDWIKNNMFCPFCGFYLRRPCFQTKSFRNQMDYIDIYAVKGYEYEIYITCPKCRNWIELSIGKEGVKRPKVKYETQKTKSNNRKV